MKQDKEKHGRLKAGSSDRAREGEFTLIQANPLQVGVVQFERSRLMRW